MMVGDKRKYNTAVITLITEGASGEAPGNGVLTGEALAVSKEIGSSALTATEAAVCEKWKAHIEAARVAVNKDVSVVISNVCKIQKIAVLPLDFSVQTLELTPTLKLKRSVAVSQHQAVIDAMYA